MFGLLPDLNFKDENGNFDVSKAIGGIEGFKTMLPTLGSLMDSFKKPDEDGTMLIGAIENGEPTLP